MKSIKEFIVESQESFNHGLSNQFYKFCEELIRHLDYSQLKDINDEDPNKFDILRENEQLFIDSFSKANTDFKAISSQEYYESTTNKKWENLSIKEKENFDTQNGDIIILDENDKPICFVDIKISNKNFGAVSLGSLVNFNEDGCYICVNRSQKQCRFVSHKALVEKVKENQKKFLYPVIRGKKEGYDVEWEGQKLKSEYFVPGKEIAKFN